VRSQHYSAARIAMRFTALSVQEVPLTPTARKSELCLRVSLRQSSHFIEETQQNLVDCLKWCVF
jgi:hypothetical protein